MKTNNINNNKTARVNEIFNLNLKKTKMKSNQVELNWKEQTKTMMEMMKKQSAVKWK